MLKIYIGLHSHHPSAAVGDDLLGAWQVPLRRTDTICSVSALKPGSRVFFAHLSSISQAEN